MLSKIKAAGTAAAVVASATVVMATFFTQPIGRPGHYAEKTGMFHSTGEWVKDIGKLQTSLMHCHG